MDPLVKQYLNSIKCPICRHQIDIFEKNKQGNNYACVRDPSHYAFRYVTSDKPYRLEYEDVCVYNGKYIYSIRQHYYINYSTGSEKIEETIIYIQEVDKEFRIIEKGISKLFNYKKLLFDFQKTDEIKIINRIKTILTFQ